MRYLHLPSGAPMPILGLGTWRMGEAGSRGADVVNALRLGIDLGMTLIDTAEMYGEGGAEEVVAKAIAGRRHEVFLVTKVYPHNATRKGVSAACDRSLKRLGTDYIDLYLLHWIGNVPFEETLAGFGDLQRAGKIRSHGVSNLDTDEIARWYKLPGGNTVATNQVLYNLTRRGIERSLLPWCRKHKIPVMAYSPIDQGSLLNKRALKQVALSRGVTPAQVALAWVLHQDGVVAIPKAARAEHVRENRAALDLALTADELSEFDRAFPRPKAARPLEML
ncbi:MAG TPA: aldo/keto reductase [Stellaceae bacterium]|nr:aldo/keto reductase [Stellaceae bacterium]